MKESEISVKEAIVLIKSKKFNDSYIVVFKEKIDHASAAILGLEGVDVPENLIIDDDSNIDYSDIPELTDEFWKNAVTMHYVESRLTEENFNFINGLNKPMEISLNEILDVYRQLYQMAKGEIQKDIKVA